MYTGMAKKLSILLGLMRKSVLGRNSANNKITMAEMMVCASRITKSLCRAAGKTPSRKDLNTMAIKIPYITRAMLLPTSMVEIKPESELVNFDSILAEKPPVFFSTSTFSLLAVI